MTDHEKTLLLSLIKILKFHADPKNIEEVTNHRLSYEKIINHTSRMLEAILNGEIKEGEKIEKVLYEKFTWEALNK